MYYINTHNKFYQVLIFITKEAARQWAKAATRWTDEQIEENIKEAASDARGYFSIFPTV